MMMIDRLGIAVLITAAVGSGCSSGSDVEIGFGLRAPGDDPGPKPGLTLQTAELSVRDLTLGGHPGKKDKFKKVWQAIDLLDPASSELNMLDVNPGPYHRLSIRVGWGDDPAIFMAGLIDGVPFELEHDARITITLISEDGILVEDGNVAEPFVEFDAEQWFTDVDFAALVPSDDGVIYVDATHNVKAYETMLAAIEASIALVDERH